MQARGTHAATGEQISTWPSHNLTGQHDDMLECACSHEWCIYLHTNTFLLMIRRVVVWFPSTWWPPCGNSGCTHGLGDSKESRHRHLLFYCWIADDWWPWLVNTTTFSHLLLHTFIPFPFCSVFFLYIFLFYLVKFSFSCPCKVVKMKIFHIWSTKYRLITKLITELVCKLQDELLN